MAKYDVTHSCGHTVTHNLIGKHRDRERKIEWLGGRPCTTCWQADLEKQRAAASEAAAQKASQDGLPKLLGTERQVAWAETIRREKLSEAQSQIDRIAQAADQDGAPAAIIEDSHVWLSSQESAKWWIDNRSYNGTQLLAMAPAARDWLRGHGSRATKEKIAEEDAAALEAAKEAARKARVNERREQDRKRLAALCGEGCELAVKTDGEKRVFFGGYPAWATYYKTGNRYHAADTLVIGAAPLRDLAAERSVTEEQYRADLLAFARDLCEFWNNLRIN